MRIYYFPIGCGVAIARSVDWLIAGDAERGINCLTVVRRGVVNSHIHHLVMGRPQSRAINARAGNHRWRIVGHRYLLSGGGRVASSIDRRIGDDGSPDREEVISRYAGARGRERAVVARRRIS